MGGKAENKAAYFDKLKALLEEYKSIFIVTVDNVSSQQMHKIRKSLRSGGDVSGVVLMGKNTMVLHRIPRLQCPVGLTPRLQGSKSHQRFHQRLPRV